MRRAVAAGIAVAALVLTGCRADIVVGVDANPDGSGRVRVEVVVDKEVTDAVDLSTQLKVDDLRATGWTVEGPTPRSGGLTAVVATKPFSDPAGAAKAMGEISGADGPFKGFALTRKHSFTKTTTTFDGTVDFTKGLAAFGDPAVGAALGTGDLGVDQKALEKQIGAPLANVVSVQVSVSVPGSVDSNTPTQVGNGATWRPKLTERITMHAEGQAWNIANLAGAAGGGVVAVGVAGAGLVLVARRRRR